MRTAVVLCAALPVVPASEVPRRQEQGRASGLFVRSFNHVREGPLISASSASFGWATTASRHGLTPILVFLGTKTWTNTSARATSARALKKS